MQRRDFLQAAIALAAAPDGRGAEGFDLALIERPRVLKGADRCLAEQPVTVTASISPRSAGGRYDFFSEGDYMPAVTFDLTPTSLYCKLVGVWNKSKVS